MKTMCPVLLPLLMLVVGSYCVPANLFGFGGTIGYDSRINGTIGGHVKADRDGLSVNGTADGIIGASWAPTLVARGQANLGDKIIAGDASMKADIDNSWQPSVNGEIGRNSNGTWLLGLQPTSVLNNKLLVTPNLQVKTGDDARKLMESPLVVTDTQYVPPQLVPNYGGFAPGYPYMPNPYVANPYTSNPYENNPYAAYYAYAQAMAQAQMAQMQKAQRQVPLNSNVQQQVKV